MNKKMVYKYKSTHFIISVVSYYVMLVLWMWPAAYSIMRRSSRGYFRLGEEDIMAYSILGAIALITVLLEGLFIVYHNKMVFILHKVWTYVLAIPIVVFAILCLFYYPIGSMPNGMSYFMGLSTITLPIVFYINYANYYFLYKTYN